MLNAVSPILVGRVAEMKSRKFVKGESSKDSRNAPETLRDWKKGAPLS